MLHVIANQDIPVPTDVWSFTGALLVFVVSVIVVLSSIFLFVLRLMNKNHTATNKSLVDSFERMIVDHQTEIKGLSRQVRDMSDNMADHDLGAQKRAVEIKSVVESTKSSVNSVAHTQVGIMENDATIISKLNDIISSKGQKNVPN